MKLQPPKQALRFLRWFCRDDYLEEIEGNLLEMYEKQQTHSPRRAKWQFVIRVLFHFRPAFIRSLNTFYPKNPTIMFRHNLLLSYRNFLRYKGTFFINLIGLSSGIASALLIFLWVNDELSVDKFHANDERLYQVMEYGKSSKESWVGEHSAGLLAETLAEEMPEVEYAVASRLRAEPKTLSVDDRYLKAIVHYASQDFFHVFSYELIQGQRAQVLRDKNSVVISEKLAEQLFNTNQDVVGKTILFEHEQPYRVSGVFSGPPANSSVQFDFVLPFEVYKEADLNVLDWNFNTTSTYVLLQEEASANAFSEKIARLLEDRRDNTAGNVATLLIRPYSSAYLYGEYKNGVQAGGRIEYVRLFSVIAIFILLIACINFMNLSTAKASRRVKEIGVKKAIGSDRNTLIFQYLSESLLMVLMALVVALLLVLLFLPQFNQITGKALSLQFNIPLIAALLGISLFTGLIAGSYPALYLSGFDPVKVLKGKLSSSAGEVWTRKGLVTFQFALSVILIMAVLVVYQQIGYVQNKHLGYERENIFYFDIEGRVAESLETFLSEIKTLPGIVDAAGIGQSVVGGSLNSFSIDQWPGKPEGQTFPSFEMRPVTYGMIELLGIEMGEGRAFSEEFSAEGQKIIFNEAAIEMMNLDDPIGQTIAIQGTELEIIGVTKNFHFASLHEEVKPLFFILRTGWTHKVMAKIEPGKVQEAIAELEQFYQVYNPGFPFSFWFLDQEYQAQYIAEQRVSTLSKYFGGLAIVISCLGLFGLTSFTAERRLKEIGIRKALGASTFGIVRLLSYDFTKLVIAAIGVALPLSYFFARQWLDGFAFSIDLRWWYFIGIGVLVLLIAWLTVGLQTLKAARVNPVDTLRNE